MSVVAKQEPGLPGVEAPKAPTSVRRGTKRSASRTSSGGEDNKRSRGRPRVEPQDETAADRRRTQIRLAQRTYRQRKETTITTLQTKVSHLENIIQEMFSSFQEVKQDVDSAKVVGQDSHLSRKISDAARKFDELVRGAKVDPASPPTRSRESFSEDVEQLPSPPKRVRPSKAHVTKDMSKAQKGPKVPAPTIVSDQRGVPSVWGYEMIYDDVENVETDAVATVENVENVENSGESGSPEMVPCNSNYAVEQAPGYFDFTPQPLMMYQGYSSNGLTTPSFELPVPQSMAYQETSFGRRLHRSTLEAAVRLLTGVTDAPSKKLLYHFGHIMQYTSRDELARIFTDRLMKGTNDPLESNYTHPVHFGPFPQQEWRLPSDFRGQSQYLTSVDDKTDVVWYAPKDVEKYFEAKGLYIDPSKAMIEWETDMIMPRFPKDQSPTSSSHSGEQVLFGTPASMDSAPFFDFNSTGSNPHMGVELSGHMTSFPSSAPQMARFNNVSSMPTPSVTPTDFTDKLLERTPKRVTINVNKLIGNLIPSAVCHGRAPGYRRRDVERAFRKSIVNVVVLRDPAF